MLPIPIRRVGPDEVVVTVLGSQGDPISPLAGVAVDAHRHLSLERGDSSPLDVRRHATAEERSDWGSSRRRSAPTSSASSRSTRRGTR
jgi:hypothetical protein